MSRLLETICDQKHRIIEIDWKKKNFSNIISTAKFEMIFQTKNVWNSILDELLKKN